MVIPRHENTQCPTSIKKGDIPKLVIAFFISNSTPVIGVAVKRQVNETPMIIESYAMLHLVIDSTKQCGKY
ncbi:hypothetical protein FM109_04065 [Vibrio casei]|nr:hypothetical protein FM109_04065 [Vibrio casei]